MSLRWIEIDVDGRTHRVPVAKSGGRLWYHWRGRTFAVDVGAGRGRVRRERSGGEPGVLIAPMPGKITRVAVGRDDLVTKGQVLVVMEAMKMEYTLATDVAGRVSTLDATVGASVKQGDVLVKVKPT